jgi:hypothetical protein
MRGSMDVLQLVNFEYVEGREMNRLTGIHEKEKFTNIFLTPEDRPRGLLEKRRVVSNVVNFILRTVVGETSNEQLWESFMEGMRLLSTPPDLPSKEGRENYYAIFEIVWLIKILVSLGYWESGKYDKFTLENIDYLSIEDNKNLLVEEINRAIKSTHL